MKDFLSLQSLIRKIQRKEIKNSQKMRCHKKKQYVMVRIKLIQYIARMGCRQDKQQELDPLPVVNLLVLGLDEEGKTSIVKELRGKKKEDEVSQIDSFILNKAYKLMVFELSGKAYKTWPNFITNTDIVILVLSQMKSDSIEKLLSLIPEMQKQLLPKAKLMLLFNNPSSSQTSENGLSLLNSLPVSTFHHDFYTHKYWPSQQKSVQQLYSKIQNICDTIYKYQK